MFNNSMKASSKFIIKNYNTIHETPHTDEKTKTLEKP